MKQTKLILTRTALLLFVMLLTQTAWAKSSLGSANVKLTIPGTTTSVTLNPDEDGTGTNALHMTYSGKYLYPNVVVLDGNTEVTDGNGVEISFFSNVYAGQATITIKNAGHFNNGTKSITKYFIIDKANLTISAELIATERIYNGDPLTEDEVQLTYTLPEHHTIQGVQAGFAENNGFVGPYTILVSNEEGKTTQIFQTHEWNTNNTAATELASPKDVTNCFDIKDFQNGSLTVKQRAITITAKQQGIFFGESITTGLDQVTVNEDLSDYGDELKGITLTTENEHPTEEGIITPSAAIIKKGETDVTPNYDITYVNGNLTISEDQVIVTITGKNETVNYDNNEHSVSGYDFKIEYPESSSEETHTYKADYFHYQKGEATTPVAKGTNANTYNMELTKNDFVNTNTDYEVTFVVAADGYLTINPIDATVTIVGNNNTVVYDSNPHSVSNYTATASTTLYDVTSDFEFNGTAVAGGTDAGTYYMKLKADDFTNTNTNFAHVTFNVTDGYQTITPLAVTVTITGHNGGFEYNNQEHVISGYDIEISDPLYTEADFTFSGSAEANRTEIGTTYMGLNTNQFKNINSNFNVNFNVTDGFLTVAYHIAELADDADNTLAISSIVEHNDGMSDVILAGRTLYKDGAWNTICLPFDVTIAGSPLAGADVRELSNASFADGELNLEFSAVTAIKAGVPYIIKWASGSNIEGVSLSTELKDKAISLGDGKSVTFKGTYAPVAYAETNKSVLLVGEESTLYYPEAGAYTNAQRAYFQLEGLEVGTVESNAIGLRFGDATGIINVLTPAADAVYYDLSGRCIKGQPTETGIYIVNGKKVVIK